MIWLDDSDAAKIQIKKDLLRLLGIPSKIILCRTPQRDMSVLPVDPPLTVAALLDLMNQYIAARDVLIQTMDSQEEAFVFKFIELQSVDGDNIPLYVKAKFGEARETLILFAVHPDRRW